VNIPFLSDLPVDNCGADRLEMSEHVKEVVKIITQSGCSSSQNISIYGDWGKGKTSFLKMVENQLGKCNSQKETGQDKHVVTVFYQAWRYDSDKYPLETLIGTLIEKLSSEKAVWYKKVHDHLEKIFAGLEVQASTGLLGSNFSLKYNVDKTLKQKADKKAKNEANLTTAQRCFKKVETLTGLLSSNFSLKYNADEAHLTIAQKCFKQVNPFNPQNAEGKIVLFLDDLDRCQPDVAIRLLEGLKQIFDFHGFFIVMGLNKRILDGYVKKRFEEMGIVRGGVHRYFEKLFKTEIDLNDNMVQTGITSFLEYHMQKLQKEIQKEFYSKLTRKADYKRHLPDDHWQTIIQIITIACQKNPRTAIKLFNEYILQINLKGPVKKYLEKKNFSQQDFEVEFFDTCLKYAAPSLYAELKLSGISRDCFLYLKNRYDKENYPFLVNFCNHFTNREELRPGIGLLNTELGELWIAFQTNKEQDYDSSFLLQEENLLFPDRNQFLLQLCNFYLDR